MRGSLLLLLLISRRPHFDCHLPFPSAGDIINGNKGRDGHFARTDLTGESGTRSGQCCPSSLLFLSSKSCVCRHAGIAYVRSRPSACKHSLFMEHVSVLLFVCFTQWWKKMIRSPADFTSPAQITTKTTVSMETASSPTSWPSPPAGTHK